MMNERITFRTMKDALAVSAARLRENRQIFNDLDSEIGDSDHGDSIDFTFKKVLATMDEFDATITDIGILFKAVGRAIILSGGAAMGPLYGTAFVEAGKTAVGKDSLDISEFVQLWKAFVTGIINRGGVTLGEKTMLDTVGPAVDALEAAVREGSGFHEALDAATAAADEGMESTKEMVSLRGRSSRLGDRSAGHIDPGASSMNVFLSAFWGVIAKNI